MTHLGAISGETEIPFRVRNGWGLRRITPGTLNGSSPTANLAGVNIKGNELVVHFHRYPFFSKQICGSNDDRNDNEAAAQRGCPARGGDSLRRLGHEQSLCHRAGLCRRGIQFVLADRGMCLLTALVGVNYMAICKHYPDGGGVYASVRHRSEIISIVGAFLLDGGLHRDGGAQRAIRFSLSGRAASGNIRRAAILVIGALNYFGPKHTGGLAFLVSVPTVVVVVVLGAFAFRIWARPCQLAAAHRQFLAKLERLCRRGAGAVRRGGRRQRHGRDETQSGCTVDKPNVSKTSTPAILWVMIEVCIFTALLGLAMHALPNLVIEHG